MSSPYDPTRSRLEGEMEELKQVLRELIRLDDAERARLATSYARGSPWARAWDRARQTMRRLGP